MPDARKLVGILTIHHVPNYGAFLQAWSLARAVRELGHEVEIVDYRHPKAIEYYKQQNSKSRFGLLRSWYESKMIRYECSQLPLSPLCRQAKDLEAVAERYESVICGSDQIWQTKGMRGFDPAYFLNFVRSKNTRRISYAPSCSGLDSFAPNESEVTDLLEKFHSLSARDARTLELVRGLGDFKIQRVVDPTLLVDVSELERAPKLKQKYLLLYGGMAPWAHEAIRLAAKKSNLKIISVGNWSRIADKSYPFVTPDKWLGYFRNATAVITSAFHGVMFAIKYRKPLLAIPLDGKKAKISDAMQVYGLSDRLVLKKEDTRITADKLCQTYNVDHLVQPLIEQSKDYLKQALDG